MATFNYRHVTELSIATLDQRFDTAEGAEGIDDWRVFARTVRSLADASGSEEGDGALLQELDRFVQTLAVHSTLTRQALFVSHQRADTTWAERVAWEAVQVGFDYWLDVHDPLLVSATSSTLPQVVQAVLIAGIIEIALLNCTHLVALQTPASQKSRWVPYEFGRAKQRMVTGSHTASWFETGTAPDPNGDYLSLAVCAETKKDLRQWLAKVKPTPPQHPPPQWPQPGAPPDLPN